MTFINKVEVLEGAIAGALEEGNFNVVKVTDPHGFQALSTPELEKAIRGAEVGCSVMPGGPAAASWRMLCDEKKQRGLVVALEEAKRIVDQFYRPAGDDPGEVHLRIVDLEFQIALLQVRESAREGLETAYVAKRAGITIEAFKGLEYWAQQALREHCR